MAQIIFLAIRFDNEAIIGIYLYLCILFIAGHFSARRGRDVAQAVEHSAVKVWILLHGGSTLHGGCICSLGYFLFQPVVHNWPIIGCGICCSVSGKLHVKYPLLLIGKSNLCGNSRICYNDYMLHIQ